MRAKIRRREWGRERKETLADKPLDFENLRSPANGARDWLSQSNVIDMCRSKALTFRVPGRKFKVCLQKAFSRNEYLVVSFDSTVETNPVVQFGISKPDYYCRCNCDTICSWSFNFNITFLNADLRQGHDKKPPPPFYFCSQLHFSREQNAENPVLRSLLHGNACYAG